MKVKFVPNKDIRTTESEMGCVTAEPDVVTKTTGCTGRLTVKSESIESNYHMSMLQGAPSPQVNRPRREADSSLYLDGGLKIINEGERKGFESQRNT